MQIQTAQYDIEIIDDRMYRLISMDNIHTYLKCHIFSQYEHSSQYGILVNTKESLQKNSCIIIAGGGFTGVHQHSAIAIDNELFIAIGDRLCCLPIPSLEIK